MTCVRLLLSAAVFCYYLDESRSEWIDCPGLGSYTNDPPFQDWPLPQCPESIDMKLYSRRNPTEGQIISRNDIPSAFNGTLETWFIVHGYSSDSKVQWMHDIKDAALGVGDFNVIIVGWEVGAKKLFYSQAASNTRTVGGEIALVANNMINQSGSHQSRLYCVGHSLGSHVCGHAGQSLKFGRITGLDPAGPIFDDCYSSCGLNPSCAELVDVVHTDGQSPVGFYFRYSHMGTMKPLGHIDFYPNGGWGQPGCSLNVVRRRRRRRNLFSDLWSWTKSSLWGFAEEFIECNHERAYQYFIESLRNPCFLSRTRCPWDYGAECTTTQNPIQSFGYAAKDFPSRGIFYLRTNSQPPYCLDYYYYLHDDNDDESEE